MAGRRVIALFDVDGTLTVPRKVTYRVQTQLQKQPTVGPIN